MIPSHVKTFALTKVSRGSTTYHFRPTGGHGWALCTVNDETHELAIQSDWGNWQYRWNSSGMPLRGEPPNERPITLTEFLGEIDDGHCDYIADKLTPRAERHVFDPGKTIAAMRAYLGRRRLEQGRALIEYFADCEPAERIDVGADVCERRGYMDTVEVKPRHTYQTELWPLTKSIARSIYNALGKIDYRDEREFTENFFLIDGHEWITEEPWEHFEHTPSVHYYQLLHGILPALVAACRKACTTGIGVGELVLVFESSRNDEPNHR